MTWLAGLFEVETLNLLALLAVVFIGLPHGAMDGALAVHFGWMGRPAKAAVFLLSYVGIAALVVVFWLLAPVLSFVAFLAISAYHFGSGDATSGASGRGVVESFARGGVVIGGISQFHRHESNEVFLAIVGTNTAAVWMFLDAIMVLTVVCVVEATLFKQDRERASFLSELISLSLLFYFAPPLVGFAVYFCFVHSLRHFSSMSAVLRSTVSRFRITQTTVAFSLISWAVGLLIFAQQSANIGMEPALLQVVFVGLAALTVPHMILVDGILDRRLGERATLQDADLSA